jgi:hypothetical protein
MFLCKIHVKMILLVTSLLLTVQGSEELNKRTVFLSGGYALCAGGIVIGDDNFDKGYKKYYANSSYQIGLGFIKYPDFTHRFVGFGGYYENMSTFNTVAFVFDSRFPVGKRSEVGAMVGAGLSISVAYYNNIDVSGIGFDSSKYQMGASRLYLMGDPHYTLRLSNRIHIGAGARFSLISCNYAITESGSKYYSEYSDLVPRMAPHLTMMYSF